MKTVGYNIGTGELVTEKLQNSNLNEQTTTVALRWEPFSSKIIISNK
jgi:hypothetical protein